MNQEAIMQALYTGLVAALPHRHITRSYKPFDQHKTAQRLQGIITLTAAGLTDLKAPFHRRDHAGRMPLVIMSEIRLPEKSEGVEIEQAEFALFEEIRDFVNQGDPCVDLIAMRQSLQLDAPEAWIQVDLEYSELDT